MQIDNLTQDIPPMKPTLTLLALLLAGVIQLQAQEPTANETAWAALLKTKKTEAPASPEALVIKDSIVAGTTINRAEANVVALVTQAQGGLENYQAAMRSVAQSNKTGTGVSMARAIVKHWDLDPSDWTEEMIFVRTDLAANLATRFPVSPEFKDQVWAVSKSKSAHRFRSFFKSYRSGLSKAEQLEATRKQKDLVLAIPMRDAIANAWLAEISADLIALQLDQ